MKTLYVGLPGAGLVFATPTQAKFIGTMFYDPKVNSLILFPPYRRGLLRNNVHNLADAAARAPVLGKAAKNHESVAVARLLTIRARRSRYSLQSSTSSRSTPPTSTDCVWASVETSPNMS